MPRRSRNTRKAPAPVTTVQEAIKGASRYVRTQQRDTGTPERLARAGNEGIAVETTDQGALVTRLTDAPIDRLYRRGHLDGDAGRNRALFIAADEYRQDADIIRSGDLSAMDPSESVRIAPTSRLPLQEAVTRARHRLERKRASLPREHAEMFDAVVLGEMQLNEASVRWTRYAATSRSQGIAVIIDRLAQCCAALARMEQGDDRAANAVGVSSR